MLCLYYIILYYILMSGLYCRFFFITGDAGDSLARQNKTMFSTKDADNDRWRNNCAVKFHGAWWFNDCQDSNLNARYLHGHHTMTEWSGKLGKENIILWRRLRWKSVLVLNFRISMLHMFLMRYILKFLQLPES